MQQNSKSITAVALSGGVDSLVSAYLLQQKGAGIFGLHFITGYESFSKSIHSSLLTDRLSGMLGIDVHVVDIREKFEKLVVDYFVDSYLTGKTPNPCMLCNREIKFGIMLEEAEKFGANRLATGHYATTQKLASNLFALKKSIDRQKDQSYFLAMLTQRQLEKTCFMLGGQTKTEVRKIAGRNNLHPVFEKESQDICFVKNKSLYDFIRSKAGKEFQSGDIVDAWGVVLGRHNGLFRYTIGQRRGINCPAPQPYYVIEIDVEQNRLVVGYKDELLKNRCYISGINWIMPKPDGPVRVKTRIRYRHEAAESILTPINNHSAVIDFKTPQAAITPGQASVCYDGDFIVAAGWIEKK